MKTPFCWLVGIGSLLIITSSVSAQVTPTVIARTGTGAGSVNVMSFGLRPVASENGMYAFTAAHDVDGFDAGLFYGAASATTEILRTGIATPGIAGTTVDSFSGPAISANGTAFFRGELSNGTNSYVMWNYSTANGFQQVARNGQAAPGTTSNFSSMFFDRFPVINATGVSVFAGQTSTVSSGIWAGTPGSVQAVALRGGAAPDLPGVTYNQFGQLFSGPRVNASGQFVFTSTLTGASTTDMASAIFAGPQNDVRLVVQAGTVAPSTGGATYINLDTPLLSNTGVVVFGSQLKGTGVTTSNDTAIFAQRTGQSAVLVVRESGAAPGLPGVTYTPSTIGPRLGGNGTMVFFGQLAGTGVTAGTNDQAFWYGTPEDPQVLVRRGDAAPGVPGGTFTNLLPVSDSGAVINGKGTVVFRATVTTGSGSFESLWGGTLGNLHLLVRQGQVFDVDPDTGITENRTLTGFDYLAVYDSASGQTALTDTDVFVFRGSHSGGQAILAVTVPVPEPATVGLVATAGLAAIGWVRRRVNRRVTVE